MSEVTSRPAVKSVSTEAIAASAALLGATAVFVGKAIAEMIAEERAPVRRQARTTVRGDRVAPLSTSRREQLAEERRVLAESLEQVPALEAIKASTLAGIEAGAFMIDPVEIREPLRAVLQAPTLVAAEQARTTLVEAVHRAHARTLVATVGVACQQASSELGFADVAIEPQTDGRALRVVATTPAGRALVSEVRTEGGQLSVETEVLGVHDGSCHGILDAFDAALERRGIHGAKARRSTGGVCELAASREVMPALGRPRGREGGQARGAHDRPATRPRRPVVATASQKQR